MAFVEDLSVFLADFGQSCTLAGAAVTAIVDFDIQPDPDTGVLTQQQRLWPAASPTPCARC